MTVRIELHDARRDALLGFTQVALRDLSAAAGNWHRGRWLPLYVGGVRAAQGRRGSRRGLGGRSC